MTFVGLKKGQALEDRAAQPHLEFPGVHPPPPALDIERSVGMPEDKSRRLELSSTIMKKVCPFVCSVFI